MASPTLLTPTSKPKPLSSPVKLKHSPATTCSATPLQQQQQSLQLQQQPPNFHRRHFLSVATTAWLILRPAAPACASSDDEYVKETSEVIKKVRSTLTMDRNDPNVETAVAELRETSNSWVAKYRREKALLGRASFRDIYSALNAVSGHYISFGPSAPIPAKRRARILEEMDTAEKALSRGR